VPWYFFAVLKPDGQLSDAGSTNLPDGQAARQYGTLIVGDLKRRGDYPGPGLKLLVKDDSGDVIHVIPFGSYLLLPDTIVDPRGTPS
jgi:hypothetical protein